MKNKKPIFVMLLLLLAIGGFVYWRAQGQNGQSNQLTLYGNVDIREARLSFNGSEHVGSVLVQEGDKVVQGQLLATLHKALLLAALDQATAQLEAQRQVVARLNAGSRPEEIDKGRADLAAAQARAKAARDSWHRLQRLVKKKLASTEDMENARANADATKAQVNAAQAALRLLELGPRKEDIAVARAELAARQAAVALAKQHLADAELHAPADGVIRDRILEPGDMASPQTPVLTLAFIDPVWVRAYLPESMLGRVKPGMRAEILTDSYPDKHYAGWVGYISPTAEFTPKNVETPELRTRLVYQVRVFACNPEDELRLGMPATVAIDLTQATPATARHPCGD